MKLSILIPMYNVEDYIGNCLQSVINQDISSNEYEIVVIDDGSTDNSKTIVEDYAKKHNNISLHLQTNIGLYATRNRLLQLAKGDYIYNLDSDDYITHNSFGIVINTAIENDVDVLGFDYLSTPKLDLYTSQSQADITNYKVVTGNTFLSKNIYHANTVWWYIVKRDFMVSNLIKFEENNPLGDGPFTLRLIQKAQRMIYLPLDIHRYVIVPTSIMNSNNHNHLIKMIENYMEIFDRYNLLARDISQLNNPNLEGVINKVNHWRDVNVYVMFYTLIKSDISIKEINLILERLKSIDAYPIKYFIGKRYSSLKHRALIFIFNHKLVFYCILYPSRLVYKLNFIRL